MADYKQHGNKTLAPGLFPHILGMVVVIYVQDREMSGSVGICVDNSISEPNSPATAASYDFHTTFFVERSMRQYILFAKC